MARGRLRDVSGYEPRSAPTGPALRLHLQPQFRGPAGLSRAHTPGIPTDGGRGSACRTFCRRADLVLMLRAWSRSAKRTERRVLLRPIRLEGEPANDPRSGAVCTSALGARRVGLALPKVASKGASGCLRSFPSAANLNHPVRRLRPGAP